MIKIYSLSIILSSLYVSSCTDKKEKLDCSNLRKGKFEYRGGLTKTIFSIERDDSIQIERNEGTQDGMKLRIDWMGTCEYKLSALAFIINGKDSAIDKSKFPLIKTRITKITSNYYVCESKVEGRYLAVIDTMLIVK